MNIFLLIVVVGSYVISPNLLYMLGVSYGGSGGGVLEKIHPCTYFVFILFFIQFISGGRNKIQYVRDKDIYSPIFLVGLLCVYCIFMGYSVAPLLVTLMTPLLMLLVLQRSRISFLRSLGYIIRFLVFANALLGIAELLLGFTLLERVAADVVIESDVRSIGFIGHPLTSSLLSALVLVFLVRSGLGRGFSKIGIAEIVFQFSALLAFGGRVALVLAVLFSVFAIFFSDGGYSRRSGGAKQNLAVRLILIGSILFGALFASQSEFAANTLGRFDLEQGVDASSETRFAAIVMLGELGYDELLTGVPGERRVGLMSAFDSDFGIESTWISWIFSYGLIWSLALAYAFILLFIKLTRGRAPALKYMSFLFVIAISGSQGLGGKTLMLTWLVTMLVCFECERKAAGR